MIHDILVYLFLFSVGHAVADFALQSDTMAKSKYKYNYPAVWFYYLTAHALIHGGMVFLVSGSETLGVLEATSHWFIDYGKTRNYYGIHVDQLLHFLCKLAWIGIIIGVLLY